MLKGMMKPKYNGNTLTIKLSNWAYKNYLVDCTYYFDKSKEKYLLSMWISKENIENRMRISSQKINTHYVPGTKDTIVENICRIVHQACITKYFDYYVDWYEYELECLERGNEIIEKDNLVKTDDNKE